MNRDRMLVTSPWEFQKLLNRRWLMTLKSWGMKSTIRWLARCVMVLSQFCVLRTWRLPCSWGRCSYGCIQHPVCTSVEQPGLKRARTDGTNMDMHRCALTVHQRLPFHRHFYLNDDWWSMNEEWWTMHDDWWMRIDDWWLMNEEWWMRIDEWWMMIGDW